MKKCLIIINKQSGRADCIDIDLLKKHIGNNYIYDYCFFEGQVDVDGYDTVAICGGDGTLSSIMHFIKDTPINVIYFPFGTVNDRARTAQKAPLMRCVVGSINNRTFTYVAACGTFTAIGYVTKTKRKKKYKSLAYFFQAFKEFKIHRIRAQIHADSREYSGDYTLIMVIKSKYCFYFPFNKLYDADELNAHLLLIKSPKHGGILGRLQLFIRFFRVFFIGIKKPLHSKNITFIPFGAMNMHLSNPADFCIDGEKITLKNDIRIVFSYARPQFNLVPRNKLQKSVKSDKHKPKMLKKASLD